MANTSAQSKRCENKTVPCCCRQLLSTIKESETVPKRPVMPRDIFDAAIKGDKDVLIERLSLQTKEQTEIQEDRDSNYESTKDLPFGSELMPLTQRTSYFPTKSNDSAPEKIRTENQTIRSELQSATHFGDTVLHLLVTKKHNELALKVFERDPSLLKTQNKMLESPLHCAAKVGNQEVILRFIDIERALVKDVLQETNEKGDTALHVAVRYDQAHFCRNLMEFDSELAYIVNKEMCSPFHRAIDEKHDFVAKQMLSVDSILACTQLTDGMFPVHLAARKNNWHMVSYFMENFPDDAELVDSCGRNLFHLTAEEADEAEEVHFLKVLLNNCEDMTTRMNNATDYEGNTPFHIAAMKGRRHTMRYIWRNMKNCVAETIKNNRGLTPYEVSRNQLYEISKKDSNRWILLRINDHEKTIGGNFSEEWFADVMGPPPLENRWERTQTIGLGSVLITTVSFAAAFTIPGGYNQDHGTPVLGRRYMFWAFILANTMAFIQGFLSLFALLIGALSDSNIDTFDFSAHFFLLAATSMVMTFGLGMYVTLAPACLPIAIIILVITLLIGSPAVWIALLLKESIKIITSFVSNPPSTLAIYAFSLLFIFCLALLSH